MTIKPITLSKQTLRRFVLGKQGIWPGRRWQGVDGLRNALLAGCVIQVDPLCIMARSHDLTIFSRVIDYRPDDLNRVIYGERKGFDWGDVIFIHPMGEIPYWKQIMQRKIKTPYWDSFADEYKVPIQYVKDAIKQNGPMSGREFKGEKQGDRYWRSAKDTGRAMYYLWIAGELMTSHRRGFERYYDFTEKIIPEEYKIFEGIEATENYMAKKIFIDRNVVSQTEFKSLWSGMIGRKVEQNEALAVLSDLMKKEEIIPVQIKGEKPVPTYILTEDLPLLYEISDGSIPVSWIPLQTSTDQEVVFMAPLEITSARGRAKKLFDFDYIWEVYKPVELRRWGYYTIPILYQDRLVARMDSKYDRKNRTFIIIGYWQEIEQDLDGNYVEALQAGLRRLIHFLGAERVDIRCMDKWPEKM